MISGYTGTVYIKVTGNSSSSTGTYSVMYEAGDGNDYKETAVSFPANAWRTGAISPSTDDIDWYYFQATSAKTYILKWDEYGGSGNYTADIRVSVYKADGSTPLNDINDIDTGYSSSRTFSGYTGTVYIKVTGSSTGTYTIAYQEN
ncbi:MAG: hypothetical protein LBK62_05595 [Treponema sp.]|jgi:hypothetical protein|nr:hypothetical protein [Treponema sp.]